MIETSIVRFDHSLLFKKGVRVLNEDHIGHVMKETDDKIVIFGDSNYRFDVPKSKIKEVGRNFESTRNEYQSYQASIPNLQRKYDDFNQECPTSISTSLNGRQSQ
jgi:hypothetical protein